jgi:uncharacterized protein (DUF2062 family)
MPKKYLRRWLPDQQTLNRNAFLRRVSPWLGHPNLWHLNRRAVAGGVAVGFISGAIPGPLQVMTATGLAILLRVNLPVAIFTTFYTNPLTIVPLYVLAYGIGNVLTGNPNGATAVPQAPAIDWAHWSATLSAWMDWMLSLGMPLLIGLVTLAFGLALAGYLLVQLGWRLYVLWALRQRRRRRPTPR